MGDNGDVFYHRLLGAIFPEAVRQAEAERAERRVLEKYQATLRAYLDQFSDGWMGHEFWMCPPTPAPTTPAPASPLPSWRSRPPAEVAEYDRRFLHVLGITPL